MNAELIIRCGFVFAGFGCLITAAIIFWKTANLKKQGTKVMGRIVRIDESKSTDSDGARITMYKPVVEYITLQNQTITTVNGMGLSWLNYAIGQQVFVYYDSKDANQCIIDDVTNTLLIPIIFLIVGLVFLVLAWFFI